MTFEEWWIDQHGQNWRAIFTHSAKDAAEESWNAATEAAREACSELLEQQHAWISNVAAANIVRGRSNATPAEVLEKMRRRLELK